MILCPLQLKATPVLDRGLLNPEGQYCQGCFKRQDMGRITLSWSEVLYKIGVNRKQLIFLKESFLKNRFFAYTLSA